MTAAVNGPAPDWEPVAWHVMSGDRGATGLTMVPGDSYLGLLPEDDRTALQKLGRTRLLDSRHFDPVAHGRLIVLKGAVKVFHAEWASEPGRVAEGVTPAVLVDIVGPGDLAHPASLLTGRGQRGHTWAETAGTIVVTTFGNVAMREFLDTHPAAMASLARVLAAESSRRTARQAYARGRVEHRVLALLRELAERHGRLVTDGGREGLFLDLGLSQSDLAAAIGASETAVETALRTLRRKEMVTTQYRKYVLYE